MNTNGAHSSTGAVFNCSSALQSWSGQEVDLLPQRMPLRRGMTSSICSSALQSWSGQEVDLLPQRMPLRRGMTSSMCCPRTNWLMP